jgi:hypothetical protein
LYRLLYLLVSTSVYFLWESWDSCYSSTLIEHCQNVSIYCVMVIMNKVKNKQQIWFNQVNTTILTAIQPRSLLRISTTFYWHCFENKLNSTHRPWSHSGHHWSAYFVICWASHIPHSIWFDVAISIYKNVKNNISYRF